MPTDKIARLRELFQAATGPDSERQMVAALTLEQQMEATLPHLLAIAEAAEQLASELSGVLSGAENDALDAYWAALTAFEEAQQ